MPFCLCVRRISSFMFFLPQQPTNILDVSKDFCFWGLFGSSNPTLKAPFFRTKRRMEAKSKLKLNIRNDRIMIWRFVVRELSWFMYPMPGRQLWNIWKVSKVFELSWLEKVEKNLETWLPYLLRPEMPIPGSENFGEYINWFYMQICPKRKRIYHSFWWVRQLSELFACRISQCCTE